MKAYKYLLFDLDGTLFDFSATESIALKNLFHHIGVEWKTENLSIYHKVNNRAWREYENGIITMQELKIKRIKDFYDEVNVHFNAQEGSNLFINFLSMYGIAFPGAIDALEKLKEHYKLALITNGIAKVQRGRLKDIEERKLFKDIFISEEMGVQKPSKEYFDFVISHLNANKDECLIIGDGLNSDIKGGKDNKIDTLYLHLGKENLASSKEYTYHCDSYEKMLGLLLN